MEALEGSLICDGPTTSGFDTLSSGTLASVRDNFTIQNTEGLSNVSFPGVLSLGALTIAGNADLLEFDGMNHLTKVDGPIHINGSLTKFVHSHSYFECNMKLTEAVCTSH